MFEVGDLVMFRLRKQDRDSPDADKVFGGEDSVCVVLEVDSRDDDMDYYVKRLTDGETSWAYTCELEKLDEEG